MPALCAEGKFFLRLAAPGKGAFGWGGDLVRWAVIFRQRIGETV
jgi:hypothetical protein